MFFGVAVGLVSLMLLGFVEAWDTEKSRGTKRDFSTSPTTGFPRGIHLIPDSIAAGFTHITLRDNFPIVAGETDTIRIVVEDEVDTAYVNYGTPFHFYDPRGVDTLTIAGTAFNGPALIYSIEGAN